MALIQGQIVKFILSNGLVVLVNPMDNIPKVSMEMWYHVGSKDEKSGEKGLAHLIEHMIFKGTEKDLSESDINLIVNRLSGYTNAFTSHDATGYIYQFPSQHWREGFTLLADCMRNARFDEQMLNSELKAVIQELKMYKDRYVGSLVDELISAMFVGHPYHYPIIGFKQDLWNLKRDTLFEFYKKHYVPNNAVLVVVGDVEPQEVLAEAEKAFGSIPADRDYKKETFYQGKDLVSKSVTLYRDVQHPVVLMAALLPGAKEKKGYLFEVLSWLLGAGKGSRLTKKLVDELELATDVQTFVYDLEDASPFFICFEPKNREDIEKIKTIINQEIADIVKNGITKKELDRATKKVKTSMLDVLEQGEERVHAIGQAYLHTKDENFIFNYTDYKSENLGQELQDVLASFFSPSMIHEGKVLPLAPEDKEQWVRLRQLSDEEDARILDGRQRDIEIEPPRRANEIQAKDPKKFKFHSPEKFELENGLKVFVHDNKELPKIDLFLTLEARADRDPKELQGLYSFVCDLLIEGTENYPGTSLADEMEQYGMSLSLEPGRIKMSMLSQDFKKGLELLCELLTKAVFESNAIEKIRTKFLTDLKFFWDDPRMFGGQLLRQAIYKDHPYAKNFNGTIESIGSIKANDLKSFYSKHFTPKGARLAIVGDLQGADVKALLEECIGSWEGSEINAIEYPAVELGNPEIINYKINRDQVVLIFGRPSITRLDQNYDKLLLFEQIFSASSMASRLFQLRERTGLFYTITGSIAANADEQPGFFAVQTIVSLDRLGEAEKAIKNLIDTVVDTLTVDELQDAKQAIINAQVNNFSTNKRTAGAFLAVDRFGFPPDYFDTRAEKISAITLEQVQEASREFLDSSKMITLKIGRV